MSHSHPICQVVSDGRAGMENQALGLAEALARLTPLEIRLSRIAVRAPWKHLPGAFWGDPFSKLATPITLTPAPDIWIACGRLTLPFSKAMKKRGNSFVVQLQDPKMASHHFDLVLPPAHDQVTGSNVVSLTGSPNRMSVTKLAEEAALLKTAAASLPSPRIAVLIGGKSKAYRLTSHKAHAIMQTLHSLAQSGAGLMISTSRRTDADFVKRLQEELKNTNALIWTGDSTSSNLPQNPYFGFLGLADHILVTEESTNMMTEAAFTGKPVHLLSLAGGNAKFRRLHEDLAQRGITRPLSLPLQEWHYDKLNETERAARTVLSRWQSQLEETGKMQA